MANLGKSRGRVLVPILSTNECVPGPSSRGRGGTATPPSVITSSSSPSAQVFRRTENYLPVSYGLLSNEDYVILSRFFQPSSPFNDGGDVDILLKIGKLDVYLPRKLFEYLFPVFGETSSSPFLTINENPSHFFQMIKCLFPCPDCRNVDETNVFFLLELSIKYRVSAMIDKCKAHILTSINEKNWTKYLTLARKLRLKHLAAFIVRRAASFPYEVLKLSYENLPSVLVSLILDAKLSVMENMNFIARTDVTAAASLNVRDLSSEGVVLEDATCRRCRRTRKANVHSSYAVLYMDRECSCLKIRDIDDRLLLAYLKPIATNLGPNIDTNS